jgi:pilus assembly protein Flp/PilA
MQTIMRSLIALKTDTRGVTALEYGIIAGVLGLALVGIFKTFGTSLGTLFTGIATSM